MACWVVKVARDELPREHRWILVRLGKGNRVFIVDRTLSTVDRIKEMRLALRADDVRDKARTRAIA